MHKMWILQRILGFNFTLHSVWKGHLFKIEKKKFFLKNLTTKVHVSGEMRTLCEKEIFDVARNRCHWGKSSVFRI